MRMSKLRMLVLCLGLVGLVCTCAAPPSEKPVVKVATSEFPKSVAILPFANATSNPDAPKIVRRMFYNFFSSLNYEDVELAELDDTLKAFGLYDDVVQGKPVSLSKIGNILHTDGIFEGKVISFGKTYAILYSEVRAGMSGKLINVRSGKAVWIGKYTAHLREGGAGISPVGLALTAVRTLVNLRQASTMRVTADLCMNLVSRIPNPEARLLARPKIKVLVHNGADSLIQPGRSLKVVMVGEPGGKATFDIIPLKRGIPLVERKKGIYVGKYVVKRTDRVINGSLVGHLTVEGKGVANWADTLGPVSFGRPTRLPAKVMTDLVLTPAKSPYLVSRALVVAPGATLRIKPGTMVLFSGPGLVIHGKIQAMGHKGSPVIFKGVKGNVWKGILLDGTKDENLLRYCRIRIAKYGVRASKSRVMVTDSNFSGNEWGILLENSEAQIMRTTVTSSSYCGLAARGGTLKLANSTIAENGLNGVLLENCKAEIHENAIVGNRKWDMRIGGEKGMVNARQNWWGVTDPAKIRVKGDALLIPVLDREPILK